MKKTILLLIFSTIFLNSETKNVKVINYKTEPSFTNEMKIINKINVVDEINNLNFKDVAKEYCLLLTNGNIKELSKHFIGLRLSHINNSNISTLDEMSFSMSNKYSDADCEYININREGGVIKAYPYGVSRNMEFKIKGEKWIALNY